MQSSCKKKCWSSYKYFSAIPGHPGKRGATTLLLFRLKMCINQVKSYSGNPNWKYRHRAHAAHYSSYYDVWKQTIITKKFLLYTSLNSDHMIFGEYLPFFCSFIFQWLADIHNIHWIAMQTWPWDREQLPNQAKKKWVMCFRYSLWGVAAKAALFVLFMENVIYINISLFTTTL